MKLKESNDILQKLIDNSLTELSDILSQQREKGIIFSYWINPSFLDNDKNQCIRGVLDFATVRNGQVVSFKYLLDRVLVLRPNEGTVENPKLGKQQGYEELRRKLLHELIGKGIGSIALALEAKTPEQIEEFNKLVPENKELE